MSNTLPAVLAPYLEQCISSRSLTLLTSVSHTPTNWLLVRFLALLLQSDGSRKSNKVIFISIYRSLRFWSELAQKSGIRLTEYAANGRLHYIDGLNAESAGASKGIVPLSKLDLARLRTEISNVLDSDKNNAYDVLIDGLDFLVAIGTTNSDPASFLPDLQARENVASVILTGSADAPLLHNISSSHSKLELEHSTFTRSTAYQAGWVLSLRPLETGFSREVDGSIRIQKGGASGQSEEYTVDDRNLEGGEWLYRLSGDGSVKVWIRGEA